MDNEQLKTELSSLIARLANTPHARTLAVDCLEALAEAESDSERTRARIRARLLLMAYPTEAREYATGEGR